MKRQSTKSLLFGKCKYQCSKMREPNLWLKRCERAYRIGNTDELRYLYRAMLYLSSDIMNRGLS